MLKKLPAFLIIILVVFTGGFIFSRYWYGGKPTSKDEIIRESSLPENYESTESSQTPAYPDTSELLKKAFSAKYSVSEEDIRIKISSQIGIYAAGTVSFDPAYQPGGGWFLAVNDNDTWKIVADGNGIVVCSLIEPYDFPTDMVPQCFDDQTKELITR